VGVVGLGAGTLAAYARPADRVDFWDIDPKAIRIARDFFTFVSDSPGQIRITRTDGRKGLEASHVDYDVIVIDAFTGDGIPAHLLTRQALATYFSRLANRHGVLLIHATNRYSTIFPIVGATAHTLNWASFKVTTKISKTTETRDWDFAETQYIVVCQPLQLERNVAWFSAEEDAGRVTRAVSVYDPPAPGDAVVWTDDRHAAIDSMDLRSYLFGK
jgi:spermidine synthase